MQIKRKLGICNEGMKIKKYEENANKIRKLGLKNE